jgi:tetratricopeptide (TPR) repeat protein
MRHLLRSAFASLGATAVLSASLASAAPAWVRVETPNFVVFGEVGERSTRAVAEQFERFREVMARILPGASSPAAVPTVVVVFRDQRSFGVYRIRYNGKPIEIGGFFVGANDENLVALSLEHREQAFRTIFHEYAHLIVSNAAGSLPVWLNEGLADYYSTFVIRSDGKSAVRGTIVPEYVRLLRDTGWIRPEELLTVRPDSPFYNEKSRQSIFYAQSWAIVHTLLNGKVDRSRELSHYARATAAGKPSLDAWREVFAEFDVNGEVRNHLSRPIYQVTEFRFDHELPRVRGDTSQISAAEVQATLGDVLRRVAPPVEAEAHLRRAAAMQPPAPRALALLGQLLVEHGQHDDARPLLAQAVTGDDWLACYTAAIALARIATDKPDSNAGDVSAAASKALESVAAVRPDLPYALAMRAQLALTTGGDLFAALEAIRRARSQAPGREDLAFIEAQVLAGRREFAQARSVIGPFMTSVYPPAVRNYAKSLMAHVVQLEKAARGLPEETSLTAPDGSAARMFLYREPGEGEKKVEGLLENIECSMRGIVVHVRVGEKVLRYAARTMAGIEFISYRSDLHGEVGCARREPPDKVFVTWRPRDEQLDASFAGWLVAIEFLP